MVFRIRVIALNATILACSYAQDAMDIPIVVAPSGEWNGVDGPWSTFNLGVGRPFQALKGIPGLNSAAFILPAESRYCENDTCPNRTSFTERTSSTWKTLGVYEPSLPTFITDTLVSGNNTLGSLWGADTVYLGNSAREIPSEIYITLLANPTFVTGVFGLSAGEFGLTTAPTTPSLLTSLRHETKTIPSLSFGYTAGSVSRKLYGSLILGGYDISRFDPNTTISIDMPSSSNRTLVVSVESISFSGSEIAWKEGGFFHIDSTLPQIWLPVEACEVFEATFGLVWDSTAELYLLSDAKHASLRSSSETIEFTIRESVARTVSYSLPYAAFDLTASDPFGNGTSSGYFPLKRASNPSQYVLGRAFLQETYVIVDYERAIFNLSQAYPEGGSPRIVAIPSANTTSRIDTIPDPGTSKNVPETDPNRSSLLSKGASAGIGVGISVVILIAIGLFIAWKRRQSSSSTKHTEQGQGPIEKAEMDGNAKPWVEICAKEWAELPAPERSQEMAASQVSFPELEGCNGSHELPADSASR